MPFDPPSNDIVVANSNSSMLPPAHTPVGSKSHPLSTGVTLHSAGWIFEQW